MLFDLFDNTADFKPANMKLTILSPQKNSKIEYIKEI